MGKITRIINGKLVEIDENSRTMQQGNDSSASYYRRQQQRKFERELTQPVDPVAFSKAYPEKARELYGDDNFRKFSN